ncbi:MAG: glycosyltransferase family 39 protein [Armatimonadetes bacterium]|nr:glycosyltransferase family 39 protein [Anaerolineae bacterium]
MPNTTLFFMRKPWREGVTRRQAYTTLMGGALLLLAAVMRLSQLDAAPPGLQHDEIFKAQEGIALVTQGDFRLFYPSNQGHEGLYVWLLGLSYVLFGKSLLMVKFPALVCGLLAVALTYRVAGMLTNRRVGTIAAGLIAVSFWAISVSRVGLRANALPVCALLVAWGVARLLTLPTKGDHAHGIGWGILAGIALGAALYTYTSSLMLMASVGVLMLYLVLFHRLRLMRTWRAWLVMGVLGVGLALPMGYVRLNDPQGGNRVMLLTRPLTDALNGQPGELFDNAWKLARMPFFTGDPEWRYNVAGRPVFATPIGLFVYLGLGVAVWRARRNPTMVLWIACALLGLVPSLLTVSAPSMLRSVLALPSVMLFVALALDVLPDKRVVWTWGALTVAVTGISDRAAYFDIWAHQPEVQAIYRNDLAALAAYLDESDVRLALVSTSNIELDPLLFAYYQPPDDVTVSFFDGGTSIALSAQPALLLISPLSPITPPHADWLTAANGATRLPPLLRADGALAFEVYRLDAQDILPARLAALQAAQPVYVYDETAPFPRGRDPVATWAEPVAYPVNFGGVLALVGVELPRKTVATQDDGVHLQLYWRPLVAQTQLPINVFAHLNRRDGSIHAQRDLLGMPSLSWVSPLVWLQDTFIVTGSTPQGNYLVTVGVYNYQTGERLPILDSNGTPLGTRLIVDRVRAEPPP